MAYTYSADDPAKAVAAELSKVLGTTPETAERLVDVLVEHAARVEAAHQAAVADLGTRLDAVIELVGQPPPLGPPRQSMTDRAFHRSPP